MIKRSNARLDEQQKRTVGELADSFGCQDLDSDDMPF